MRSTIIFRKGRTEPPCKAGGIDCIRREVGCRSDCEAWQKHEAIHEAEREEIRKKKKAESDATEFAINRPLRRRRTEQARADQRR